MGLLIRAISTYIPQKVESNQDLVDAGRVPYTADDIERKTGIGERRIASARETPVWMAQRASEKLFAVYDKQTIDWVVFCTHTPDYMLPSCSCVLHGLLDMDSRVGAFDIAHSCTGFIYSLVVCHALLSLNRKGRILLINADNYTRFLDPRDASICTIFGDAAVATLLEYDPDAEGGVLGHKLCSDGRGYENLIRRGGGAAFPGLDADGHASVDQYIRMNGADVFRFVQKNVPPNIEGLLSEQGIDKNEVDFYLLHQASEYMLGAIAQRLRVEKDKVPVRLKHFGNTVSATIPLLMHTLGTEGVCWRNKLMVLCGFGAGLSYGSVILKSGPDEIECL
jgi:3-oxoacyl-[acyl-carrier-protein] synthase III